MPYLRKDIPGSAGTSGPPASTKPTGGTTAIPPMPSEAPPPGTQWTLQGSPEKGWWWIAAAAVGAIGSYLSAQQQNKPRTGYTDQTTTQTPYREDLIRADIEAILNLQRGLVNQGPPQVSVGGRRTPVSYQSRPGSAPGPVQRFDQQQDQARRDLENWQAGGGQINRDGAGDRRPDIDTEEPRGELPDWAQTPRSKSRDPETGERTFGGWTAAELEADPSRVGKLGGPGARKYDRYRRRKDEMGSLPYLRALFAKRS